MNVVRLVGLAWLALVASCISYIGKSVSPGTGPSALWMEPRQVYGGKEYLHFGFYKSEEIGADDCILIAGIHRMFEPVPGKMQLNIDGQKLLLQPIPIEEVSAQIRNLGPYERYKVAYYKVSMSFVRYLSKARVVEARLDYGDGRYDEGTVDKSGSRPRSSGGSPTRRSIDQFFAEACKMFGKRSRVQPTCGSMDWGRTPSEDARTASHRNP
jgi:hypothetical protein